MVSTGANYLQHLAHSHRLDLLQERIHEDSFCAGCNARLLTGPGSDPYFACKVCRFYLHRLCATAPTSKKFSSVHSKHTLSLGFQASLSGKFCDVCKVRDGKTFIVGLFYECRACNFDAHISCVAPWRDNSSALYHFTHIHPVEPLESETRAEQTCAGCNSHLSTGIGTPPHFACQECGFYLHFQCAAAPSSVHLPSVHRQHRLTLGFQAAGVGRRCNVCKERKTPGSRNNDTDIVGLYYECRACNFDAHISCVEPWRGNCIGGSTNRSDLSMLSEFENLGIRGSNSRGLQQGNNGTSSSQSIPPTCHSCSGNKEIAVEVLDLLHQVAQSRTDTDPSEYQRLLQHFKDTFPSADANATSAMAMHLRYPSNLMAYKSMMEEFTTLRSYVRRVLDPRSAPPVNMSFLYTSSPAQAQIITGQSNQT